MKLLIVDDNEEFVELIIHMINSSNNYDLHADISYTGKEAIYLATHQHYDFILLDIYLPDINGIEVCKIISLQNRFINIIVMSFTDNILIIKQALEAGAKNFIFKKELNLEKLKEIMSKNYF